MVLPVARLGFDEIPNMDKTAKKQLKFACRFQVLEAPSKIYEWLFYCAISLAVASIISTLNNKCILLLLLPLFSTGVALSESPGRFKLTEV